MPDSAMLGHDSSAGLRFAYNSFRAAAGLILLFLAIPLPAAEAPVAAPAEIEIKVVSFNILGGDGTGGSTGGRAGAGAGQNAWSSRRDQVADLLRRQAPDFVSLQKGGRNSIDDLRKAIPAFGEIGVGRDDGKTGGEYAAILYLTNRFSMDESGTFWLSETPETAGSRGWGASSARVCTWARFIEKGSGVALYLFNTHLDPGSQSSRDNSAALILSRITARKHPDPFILTGDMNSPESSTTIQFFKSKPGPSSGETPKTSALALLDTFRVLHAEETEVRTRHQFTGGRQGDKVDYILVPAVWKVTEAGILHDALNGQFPSDHFPVAATLRWSASR